MLQEYCLVDRKGNILGVERFNPGGEIPKGYVKIWEGILQEPTWNHLDKCWVEKLDLADELIRAKETKVTTLQIACQNAILGRFNARIRKKEYSFSYDKEAQMNLTERWQLFQNNMVDSLILTAKDVLTGEVVRVKVNKVEFTAIYLASVKHKEDNISRLHDLLIPLVNKAVSIKQISDIHWTNEMIYPNEPSITIKEDKTLDKSIEKVEAKAEMISQANQLNGLAMIEVANFVFANGFNKVP